MLPAASGRLSYVDRPSEASFHYVTDPSRFPEWQGRSAATSTATSTAPTAAPGVGARWVTVRRIGGAERASTSELVPLDPPRTWAVRGIDRPSRAAVDVTVEPLGADRSTVTIAVHFTGHGIGKVLVPLLVRRQAAKEMPATLARLNERLEAGAYGHRPQPSAGPAIGSVPPAQHHPRERPHGSPRGVVLIPGQCAPAMSPPVAPPRAAEISLARSG